MNTRARHRLIRALALAGFGIALIVVEGLLWSLRDALGPMFWWLQLPLGLMTLAATWLTRDESPEATTSLLPGDIAAEGDVVEARAELRRMAERIDERDRELTERLKTFHEWLEFPQPLNLAEDHPATPTNLDHNARDQELFELLESESRKVFDRILANAYTDEQGQVRAAQIRDETVDFIQRIARIYHPGAKEPLLETSVARILHAASRASLQFLVVLEELPVGVKDHSLQDIYDYVRKGVKAYGVYKHFEPYKPYVDTAYYLGRFAMGASPLSLGAWWIVGTLGQKGLQAVTTHYLEGQALAFLHNLIRVVGYEVAGLYGGDFPHRDPNWLYAVEVVELVHTFPASRRSLARALTEIGRLSLRSEYDRVFLYRALAAHKSAEPDQYDASVLSATERSQIAKRLELLLHEEVPGARAETIQRWREAVEARLNIKVRLDAAGVAKRSEQESARQAAHSLASYLVGTRELEASKAVNLLKHTRSMAALDPAHRTAVLAELQANPPFFFEPPDLDPADVAAENYLADLTALAVETPPFSPGARTLVTEVAAYLRQDEKTAADNFDQALIARVSRNLSAHQPEGQLTAGIAAMLATALPADAAIRFVYCGITLDPTLPGADKNAAFVLHAMDGECALRELSNPAGVIWRSDASARAKQNTTLGQGHCAITGGVWTDQRARTIRVDLPLFSGYATHFRALLERIPAE